VVPLAMAFLFTIWLTLDVGILPLLEGLALLVFLPGAAFERLAVAAPSVFAPPAWLRALAAPATLQLRLAGRITCLAILVDIVTLNLDSLSGRPLPSLVVLRPLASRAGLEQRWRTFTAPSHTVAWTAVVGETPEGQVILNGLADDLSMSEDPRARARSPHLVASHRSARVSRAAPREPGDLPELPLRARSPGSGRPRALHALRSPQWTQLCGLPASSTRWNKGSAGSVSTQR
jgi:hypothetical protein